MDNNTQLEDLEVFKDLLTKVWFQERISLLIQDKDKGLKEVEFMMILEVNIAILVKARFFIKEEVQKDQLPKLRKTLSHKSDLTQDKTMILRVD